MCLSVHLQFCLHCRSQKGQLRPSVVDPRVLLGRATGHYKHTLVVTFARHETAQSVAVGNVEPMRRPLTILFHESVD